MNPRRKRQFQTIASIAAISGLAGLCFALAQSHVTLELLVTSVLHGVLIGSLLTIFETWMLRDACREWIGRLSFSSGLILRSFVYVLIFVIVHAVLMEARYVLGIGTRANAFFDAIAFSAIAALAINFMIQMSHLIGPRTLISFFTGRYHEPREENRFVLFVDIVGSTGLAERLGGIGIHRFLDRTFRLLNGPVVDHRGEILGYVGDELIVTWRENEGAAEARPLRCFLAMRATLERAAGRFTSEFGTAPRIRGSLNFGPVIVGEIGDIKRAIVFNGDTMNIAARLEELSRNVDGGFLVSRAAIDQFGTNGSALRLRELGPMPIRGRLDDIEVLGLAAG